MRVKEVGAWVVFLKQRQVRARLIQYYCVLESQHVEAQRARHDSLLLRTRRQWLSLDRGQIGCHGSHCVLLSCSTSKEEIAMPMCKRAC